MSPRGALPGFLLLFAAALCAAADDEPPTPHAALSTENSPALFTAHYTADWKSINVGTSDLELKAGAEPGHYIYTWTITARGVFKLIYANPVTQTSWFHIAEGHVVPQKYRGEDGTSSVNIEFDWPNLRATGTSEKKPVDIKLKEGTQDLNSSQIEVMLGLMGGNLAKTFQILEKDQLKEFNYTREGPARIRTAIGELDTVVVASQRTGNNRILRMWFAPSLGYLPVQAERTRDGKLEFAMRLKSIGR